MNNVFYSCVLSTIIFFCSTAACRAAITVPTTANLFSSGYPSAGHGGTLPVLISAVAGQTVQFTTPGGTATAGTGWPNVGPEGGTMKNGSNIGTNVFSENGISGLIAGRFEFLAGVFIGPGTPSAGDEPPRLDFTNLGTNFLALSPLLDQSFFIGDGHTDGGKLQTFVAPAGATRLYLGIVDASNFGWPSGLSPAAYSDNTGDFTITPIVVPEPSLLSCCMIGSFWSLGRRTARSQLHSS